VLYGHHSLPPGRVTVERGKGRKPRVSWVVSGGREWLTAWLERRGTSPGPFLLQARGGGLQWGHMSTDAVYRVLMRRAKRAGIEPCTPHDLRRTFATELLDRNVDLLLVQRLLGHASPETTMVYDRRQEKRTRRAVARLPVPTIGRG
jgi:integrase/recombinase XerD